MLHTRELRIGYEPVSTGSGVFTGSGFLAVLGTSGAAIAGGSVGLRAEVARAGVTAGGGTSIGGRSGIFIPSSGTLAGWPAPVAFGGSGSGSRALGTPGTSGSLMSGAGAGPLIPGMSGNG